MKTIIFWVLSCWSLSVFAQVPPASFEFRAVPLVTFAQAVYGGFLQRNYVIAPDLLAVDKKISMSVKFMAPEKVVGFVDGILAEQGIVVVQREQVFYLKLADKPTAAKSGVFAVAAGDAGSSSAVRSAVDPVNFSGHPSVTGAHDEPRAVATVSELVTPQNRSAEFVATVIAQAFGSKSAVLAGASVVLTGSPDDVEKMRSLLRSLDVAALRVDISASWVEVARSSGSARGVSLVVNALGGRLGGTLGPVNSGGAITFGSASFQAVLDVLDTDGRFKQVSNSRVLGDDREPMMLTVGDETPTISTSGKDNQGNAIQSVVYKPSGVIVSVTPKMLGNGKINLIVDGQISSFKPTLTGVSGSPTMIKRQVKTAVTVSPGEVLLIGGLTDEHATDASNSFAFLPSSWAIKNRSSLATDLVLILTAKLSEF